MVGMDNKSSYLGPVDSSREGPRFSANSSNSGNGNGGSEIKTRLERLEERMQHTTTKEDLSRLGADLREGLQKIKVWVLAGVIVGSAAAAAIAVTVVAAFAMFMK